MTETPASRLSDENQIRALIRSQFESIDWGSGRDGDWSRFEEGFLPAARLFGARRPVRALSARDFTARLKRLHDEGALESFTEKGVGCAVFVIGNVAIAAAGCEMTENGCEVTRDVSVFLLVKDAGGWRIAAQAWDAVDDIPSAFADAGLPVDP